MALTLNRFTGFETGGLEELRSTLGSIAASTAQKRTGSYSMALGNGDSGDFEPYEEVSSAGNDHIVGFGVYLPTVSPSTPYYIMRVRDLLNASDLLALRQETNGNLRVFYQDGSYDDVTDPFTAGQWEYIEIRWQEGSSAAVDIWLNGSSIHSVTGKDLDAGGSGGDIGYRMPGPPTGNTTYFDDFYCYSGGSGTGDFLGTSVEVLGAYQNTVEDNQDQGSTLDQGTWADTGDTPLDEEATPAAYTADSADGHTICDEGARDGPAGDAGGTIKGASWVYRLKRGNGGTTTHSKRYGHNGDTTTASVSLTTAFANYFAVIEASASQCPTNSEYFAQGFAVSGGRDLLCAEMWAQLLHVSGAAIVKIMSSTEAIQEALVRRQRSVRLVAETEALTEGIVRRMWSIRLLAETVSITEGIVRRMRWVRLKSETIWITEGFVRLAILIKILSSTVSLAEGLVRRMWSVRFMNETESLPEGIVRRMWSIRQMASTISIPEGIVRRMRWVRMLASTVSISEGFLRIAGFVKIMSSTVSITEGFIRIAGFVKIMASTVSVPEGLVRRMRSVRQMSSTVALPEALIRRAWMVRLADSTVAVAEAIVRRMWAVRLAAETVELSDAGILHKRFVKLISETVGLLEGWVHSLVTILTEVDVLEFWSPLAREVEFDSPLTREVERDSRLTKEIEMDARLK